MQISVSSKKSRRWQRHGEHAQVIDHPAVSRCLRAEERVTKRTSQVKSRRQRAHRLDVGRRRSPRSSALTAWTDRQACNRRELFLSEACGLAERLSCAPMTAKRPVSWLSHLTAPGGRVAQSLCSCADGVIDILQQRR